MNINHRVDRHLDPISQWARGVEDLRRDPCGIESFKGFKHSPEGLKSLQAFAKATQAPLALAATHTGLTSEERAAIEAMENRTLTIKDVDDFAEKRGEARPHFNQHINPDGE